MGSSSTTKVELARYGGRFSSSQESLRVLRGQRGLNIEATEMLRDLCVEA
jgi:hypothetical protein